MHNHATPNYNNLQTNTTTDLFGEFVQSKTEFQWHFFFGCWINKPLIYFLVVAFFLYVDFIQCTELRFARFFSGGFITAIVINPPKRKLAKRTSVQCDYFFFNFVAFFILFF